VQPDEFPGGVVAGEPLARGFGIDRLAGAIDMKPEAADEPGKIGAVGLMPFS